MKTKKLMTAFALSAMFAACSQDVELNETLAKNDFSNVPMVEAEFTANVGAESRMATTFGWEVGDKVGLAWLGDATISGKNQSGMAYQNHPLFCTDASKKAFKTETMLYVGEYFAYMPYTAGDMAIENIQFSLDKQPLTSDRNVMAKQGIYLSTKKVVLEKADSKGNVSEGAQQAGMGKNVQLSIERLSNAATIEFTFKNASALTDLKVTGVKIDMVNTSMSNGGVLINKFLHNGQLEDWTAKTGQEFFKTNSSYERGQISLEGELVVADNKATAYAWLLPTFDVIGTTTLSLELTTNYGTVKATNVKVDNAKLFTNFGQAAKVTAEVNAMNIEPVVKSQAELETILKNYAVSGNKAPHTITLVNATKANPLAPFTLTDFTMPETLKNDYIILKAGDNTNSVINFAGNTIINKKMYVGSNALVSGTMTVKYIKDLEYTLSRSNATSTLTIDNGAVLNNEGVISIPVITKAADATKGLTFGKYISNGENAALNGAKITNNGEAQWIAGKIPAVESKTNKVYAEASTRQEITDANAAKVTVVRLLDGSHINNIYESFTFEKVSTIECYGNVYFYLTASPSGIAQYLSFALTNKGTSVIVKEGSYLTIHSNNKDNAINNLGTITVEKNASLDVQNNNTYAIVNYAGTVNTYNAPNIFKGKAEEGSYWSNVENNN